MSQTYDALSRIISDSTRYMRTYLGRVVNNSDIAHKGRVLVTIPALGILSDSEAPWADVEQPIGKNVVPAKGDWVSVYFLDGDPSKPVVRGKVTTVSDNVPDTEATARIVYKDEDTEIVLDQSAKKITVTYAGEVEIKLSKEVVLKTDDKLSIESSGDISIKSSGKCIINDHLEVS